MTENFELFSSIRYDPSLIQVKKLAHNLGWNSEKASPFYMLDYHRDRMLKAATHWGWTKAIEAIQGPDGLARLESFLFETLNLPQSIEGTRPLRVKILLSSEGQLRLESSVVPAIRLSNLFPDRLPTPDFNDESTTLNMHLGELEMSTPADVYFDTDTTHRSEYTHYKTTRREMYDQARQRVGLKPIDATKEVLIVNNATGSIMEGSLTTPYFWRGGRWVTPSVSPKFSQEDGSGGQDGTTRRWALERHLVFEGDIKALDLVDGEAVWLSNGVRGFFFGRLVLSQS